MFFLRWAALMFRSIMAMLSWFQSEAACRGPDVLQSRSGDEQDAIVLRRHAVAHFQPAGEGGARRWFGKEAGDGRELSLRRQDLRVRNDHRLPAVAPELGQR